MCTICHRHLATKTKKQSKKQTLFSRDLALLVQAYVSMIHGVIVWSPPAAKTNLQSKLVSLFSHVLINEGGSKIGGGTLLGS